MSCLRFWAILVCLLFLPTQVYSEEVRAKSEAWQLLAEMIPPVSLQGSDLALRWQNLRADWEGIFQVPNSVVRSRMVKSGELVSLSKIPFLRIHPKLKPERRYLLKAAAEKLGLLADAYHAKTQTYLQVNGASRTIQEQVSLTRTVRKKVGRRYVRVPLNANAASPTGEKASPHTRGIAVDLDYRPMREAAEWLGEFLLGLERDGCLDATREKYQPVFHITFFSTCVPLSITTF